MATIMDIGIDPQNVGLYQPKARNRWKAVFLNLGGPRNEVTGLASMQSNAAAISPTQNAITMQCTNFARPSLSFDEVALHRYNSVGYVAAKHSWSECSMTLEDDVTSYATKLLRDQLERQQYLVGISTPGAPNLLGTASTASQYKFSCELAMLDGGVNETEIWQLQGCWFKSINWGDLDYSDGSQVKIECTLRFDHAVQRFPDGIAYGTALGGAGSVI
jgi:hypothetical protein